MRELVSRSRDEEQEQRERSYYHLLEQLYVLVSADAGAVMEPEEIEDELGLPWPMVTHLTDDLARLGYVEQVGPASAIRLTNKALEYLRQRAWRRRSIRA